MSRRNRKPPRRKPRIGKVTSEADARPADDLPTKAIPLRDLAARPAAPRWRTRWEAPVSIAAAGRPEKTRDCGADFAALLPTVVSDVVIGHSVALGTAYWMLSNWIRSRVPVARATFSSVRVDGGVRPLSNRATADCVVFIRAANSAWVRPARVRASISARATSYSGPSCSYASR